MISRSNFIHLSRWIAAFLVLISHLRSILFKNYGQSAIYKEKAIQLFYFITGLGHQAVIIFFVLSGYLIISSILKQFDKEQFSFKNYAINRISRLYAVLIVALILTVILDHFGSGFDNIGVYTNKIHFAAMGFSVESRSSFLYFVASLFMLQNIVVPPLGSNGPLWSLNYEFFYYLLFPCLCIPFLQVLKGGKNFKSLLYIFCGIILFFILPGSIIIYFSLWLLGIVPIYLTIRFRAFNYILPLILLGMLFYQRTHIEKFSAYSYDLAIGIIFSLWLCCFGEFKYKSKFYKLNEWFASFSYTLYLVHLPLILCTLTIIHFYFYSGIAMDPSIRTFLLFFMVLIVSYVFAYLVASMTEFKTNRFKSFLEKITLKPKLSNKKIDYVSPHK